MAYSDAARVDENTKRMTTTGSVQANFRAAVKTFGDSVETIMTTYTLNKKSTQAFRDKLIDLCRYMDAEMDK